MTTTITVTWVHLISFTLLLIAGVGLIFYLVIRYALRKAEEMAKSTLQTTAENAIASLEKVAKILRTNIKEVVDYAENAVRERVKSLADDRPSNRHSFGTHRNIYEVDDNDPVMSRGFTQVKSVG